MRRILRDVYDMYTFDPREAIINSALSVTLCTQAFNILKQISINYTSFTWL